MRQSKLDPDEPDGFYIRGRIYAGQNNWKEAIVDYSEAIRLDPAFGWAYARRAAAYEATGQADSAEGGSPKGETTRDGRRSQILTAGAEPTTARPVGFAAGVRQRPVSSPAPFSAEVTAFRNGNYFTCRTNAQSS